MEVALSSTFIRQSISDTRVIVRGAAAGDVISLTILNPEGQPDVDGLIATLADSEITAADDSIASNPAMTYILPAQVEEFTDFMVKSFTF